MSKRVITSVSLKQEHRDTLDRMKAKLPGMSRSGLITEIFDMTLPMMEDLLDVLAEARDQSANDEQAIRDRLALWTGQQLLKFTDPEDDD